jgi:hypothetical protein
MEEETPRKPQRHRQPHRSLSLLFGSRKPTYPYRVVNNRDDDESDQLASDSNTNLHHCTGGDAQFREKVQQSLEIAFEQQDMELATPGQSTSAIAWKSLVKLIMSLHFTTYATAIAIFLPGTLGMGFDAAGVANQSHGLGIAVMEIGTLTTAVTILGIPIQLLLSPRLHEAIKSLGCLRLFVPL